MSKRGRPPKSGRDRLRTLSVRVTAAQRLELQRIAERSRRGISGIFREWIELGPTHHFHK